MKEYKNNNWRLTGTTYWGEEQDVHKIAKALSDISMKYKIVYLDKKSLKELVDGVHFDIGNWTHPITNKTVSQLIL